MEFKVTITSFSFNLFFSDVVFEAKGDDEEKHHRDE